MTFKSKTNNMNIKLKRSFTYTVLSLLSFFTYTQLLAQEYSGKSLLKLDVGLIGTWLNYEYTLNKKFSLLSEIGLDGLIYSHHADGIGLILSTRIKQGMRFYYDQEALENDGKTTPNKAGNFFTFLVDYIPPNLSYVPFGQREVLRQIRALSYWGLRRDLDKRLVFETHLGFGYVYNIGHSLEQKHNLAWDLRIGIGYSLVNLSR